MSLRHSALFVLGLGTLGAGLATSPAMADARVDVIAASQRCAAFADARTWLDCYYGAAQAMRSQLGLSPAPANQQRLVPQGSFQGTAAMAPPPAYTPPAYNAPVYNAPNAPAARAPNNAIASGPPPLPRRSGGWFSGMLSDAKQVRSNQRMANWTTGRDGLFIVELVNGEKWQQVYGGDRKPNWRGNPSNLVVNIEEGAMRTYNLKVSGDSGLYKVRRVN